MDNLSTFGVDNLSRVKNVDKVGYLSTPIVDNFPNVSRQIVDNVDKLSTQIVDNFLGIRVFVEMWISYPHLVWISRKFICICL